MSSSAENETPVYHEEPQRFTSHGTTLVPGWNVDVIDVRAGMKEAASIGYGDGESQMVVEYFLMRRQRGEEDGAQRTALSGGIDLTSYYRILAAAQVFPT